MFWRWRLGLRGPLDIVKSKREIRNKWQQRSGNSWRGKLNNSLKIGWPKMMSP